MTNFDEVDKLRTRILTAPDIVTKAIAVTEMINLLQQIHEFACKFAADHPMASN